MLPGSKIKYRKAKNFVATCALLAGLNTTAEAVELRQHLSVDAPVVRLHDIFTDTGALGDTVIMKAPAAGDRRQLSSYDLSQIAEKYELDWERPSFLKRVYIERESVHYSGTDLQPYIMEQIRDHGVTADVDVEIFGLNRGFHLPTEYGLEAVEFEAFTLTGRQNRFTATIRLPINEYEAESKRISGTIQEVRLIPVLNRMVTPGEVIQKPDIDWVRYPARRVNTHIITDASLMVGQTVTRALPAKRLLRKNDIAMPVMIAKGSDITMTLHAGALTLTMRGRALEDGGDGDMIRVMNTKSNRSFEARVIAPGRVEVKPNPTITVAAR